MGNKNLKEMGQGLFLNDVVTPLRRKFMYFIRQKEVVASVTIVNEKKSSI